MQNSFLMLPQRESGATWSLVVDSYCWFTEHEKEISNKIKSSFLTLRKKKVEPRSKVLFVYQKRIPLTEIMNCLIGAVLSNYTDHHHWNQLRSKAALLAPQKVKKERK